MVVQGVFHPTVYVSRIPIITFLNAKKPAALITKIRTSDSAEAYKYCGEGKRLAAGKASAWS
jgi:hypothetical protein